MPSLKLLFQISAIKNGQGLVAPLLSCLLIGFVGSLQAGLVLTQPAPVEITQGNLRYAPDSINLIEGNKAQLTTTQSSADAVKSGKVVAASSKRVSAQIQLGLQRLHGLQGPQDLKQAGQAFMLAFARSDPQAPAAVALCHLLGCYGTPDRRAVELWIERTRAREPAKAKLLEWASLEQFAVAQNANANTNASRARLQALLQEAVRLLDPVALNEQGLQQVAVGQHRAALRSFEQAAQRGSQAAARNYNLLSQMPQQQAAVVFPALAPISPVAAPGQAIYDTAVRHHVGTGMPANYSQAVLYYRQAADLGHLQAKRMLELIFSRRTADGSLDQIWMRQLAAQAASSSSSANATSAMWLQKDISLLADWLPQD
ncbi:hypothetical protein [Variovorax sp. PCZ-1]|uniref:SEL1-like repeat protein n=1 Tax=Variovorax sp. PCZ-1 TaxID=2835533 RepID=UPI001BCF80E6|nr:hypothetical protein [Variovorax sp. PCZ-1]MBS7808434.1 SEL1-like repeat protein [Variovorax sp. PCZ-1]